MIQSTIRLATMLRDLRDAPEAKDTLAVAASDQAHRVSIPRRKLSELPLPAQRLAELPALQRRLRLIGTRLPPTQNSWPCDGR